MLADELVKRYFAGSQDVASVVDFVLMRHQVETASHSPPQHPLSHARTRTHSLQHTGSVEITLRSR